MKKCLLFFLNVLLCSTLGFAQVYLDEFDNDDPAFMGGTDTYSFAESNSELTVTASNTGPWDVFTYQLHNPASGESVLIDMTENNKIFVRAKASNVGTQLRLDIQDKDGFLTSLAGITKTLTTEFMVLEFDFGGTYQDGGFGGTPCTGDTSPCPVDGTQIDQLIFYTNPGAGGFNGSVVFDYISFGSESEGVIVSDVFQDHFDQGDSTLTSFDFVAPGYSLSVNETEVTVSGDGTTAMWDPIGLLIRNQNTFEPIDIDVTGNNKMFIKVKSSTPGTALRIDIQDIDDFVNTQGSITKIIGTEYEVLEYDYSGTYSDLGFGGTPCTQETAPCPVNGERIAHLLFFIEPGVGGYVGDLTIDYISFGKSLEPAGEEPELIYTDHFSNELLEYTTPSAGFEAAEVESDLIITGDGSAAPFTAISYLLHDKTLDEQITLDMGPAKNKIFVRVKTAEGNVPLRLDVIDSTGFISSQTALTKVVSSEFTVLEYDMSGAIDGAFGGTACEVGPCPLDLSAITQLLLYPNAIEGEYTGELFIDYISIGQPAPDEEIDLGPAGIANYADQFSENTVLFISDMPGLMTTTTDTLSISGDGTSGPFSPVVYTLHNETGETVIGNVVGSGNKIFIKARSSVEGTNLRVDLQDNLGFVTNANAVSTTLTTDFVVYELDYTNAYADGGFGGSDCTMEEAPCDVDGIRIAQMQFFIDPGIGLFNGTIDIDWISFGKSLDVPEAGVVNYTDEIDTNSLDEISDVPGLVSSIVDGEWRIDGDGSSGAFSPIVYTIHDEAGEAILANAIGSGDKLFLRAKTSVEGTTLRLDLQDFASFVSNANAVSNVLTTEYAVYEFNYATSYADGGFGGSPCSSATAPCPIDGERIGQLQFFLNPGVGGFNGTLDIDWIAFGEPLTTNIIDETRLQSVNAFPNPARETLNLEMNLLQPAHLSIQVFDLFGKQVLTQYLGVKGFGQQYEVLNTEALGKGMYVLQLQSEGQVLGVLRFTKQ